MLRPLTSEISFQVIIKLRQLLIKRRLPSKQVILEENSQLKNQEVFVPPHDLRSILLHTLPTIITSVEVLTLYSYAFNFFRCRD